MSLWDDEAGYDRDDPKHPGWYDAMCDRADTERKRMKEDGEWFAWQAWQTRRVADGLTGDALSLGEFRRQQLEDEAEAS